MLYKICHPFLLLITFPSQCQCTLSDYVCYTMHVQRFELQVGTLVISIIINIINTNSLIIANIKTYFYVG